MILERYRLDNPFATKQTESDASVSTYARMVQRGQELIELPRRGGGLVPDDAAREGHQADHRPERVLPRRQRHQRHARGREGPDPGLPRPVPGPQEDPGDLLGHRGLPPRESVHRERVVPRAGELRGRQGGLRHRRGGDAHVQVSAERPPEAPRDARDGHAGHRGEAHDRAGVPDRGPARGNRRRRHRREAVRRECGGRRCASQEKRAFFLCDDEPQGEKSKSLTHFSTSALGDSLRKCSRTPPRRQ